MATGSVRRSLASTLGDGEEEAAAALPAVEINFLTLCLRLPAVAASPVLALLLVASANARARDGRWDIPIAEECLVAFPEKTPPPHPFASCAKVTVNEGGAGNTAS